MSWLLVFLGGGLGAVARFGVSRICLVWLGSTLFPWATFLANLLATGLLALLVARWPDLSLPHRWFWIMGFCGGFSTFSTFSLENYQLLSSGNYFFLFLNITASVLVGIGLVFYIHRHLAQ